MEFKLRALTDIWTGGVDHRNGDKLHLSGIKGSIRWWYETLVRGLGSKYPPVKPVALNCEPLKAVC